MKNLIALKIHLKDHYLIHPTVTVTVYSPKHSNILHGPLSPSGSSIRFTEVKVKIHLGLATVVLRLTLGTRLGFGVALQRLGLVIRLGISIIKATRFAPG